MLQASSSSAAMSTANVARTFVAAAPGKLILAGEHSVVHYTRALASVIDKRTYAEFTYTPAVAADADESALRVEFVIHTDTINETHQWTYAQLQAAAAKSNLAASYTPNLDADLRAALDSIVKPAILLPELQCAQAASPDKHNATPAVFLLYYFALLRGSARGSLRVVVESALPIGAGLGSSASFSSALASGFLWLARQTRATEEGDFLGVVTSEASLVAAAYTLPDQTAGPATIQPCVGLKTAINFWAYEGERIIHGNPSGLDNTTCVYGGVIEYRKARPATDVLPAQEGLMRPLTNIPAIGLVVVNTKVPRNTAELVAGVGAKKTRQPQLMARIFASCEDLVRQWLELLQPNQQDSSAATPPAAPTMAVDEFEQTVGTLMELNQVLLKQMGVSHPIITSVLRLAEDYGLQGKLTGAGGGGCMILLKPTGVTTAAFLEFERRLAELEYTAKGQTLRPGCAALETVVGQAGVWIREGTTLKQTPELQAK